MTRFKNLFAWIIIFFFANTCVFAQTFDDFKKQVDETFETYDQETQQKFDTFKKETQQKFDNFVAKTDKEFSDYLVGNFATYDIGQEEINSSVLKPDEIPIVEEVELTGDEIEFEISIIPKTYQGPVFPGIKKTELSDFDIDRINVSFLGWPLYFDLDKAFFDLKTIQPSAEEISSVWTKMSELNYNHFLYQFSDVANTLNLNHWGYYQLLKECSEQIYPDDNNMQVLFQWALLTRSRYKVKVGFSSDKLYLLVPSVYKMYSVDFVNLNGIEYYIIEGQGEQLKTYAKDFPEADIIMDVRIKKPFNTNPIKKSKDFHFSYEKVKYTVNLSFDEEMIKFYRTIPLSDVSVYFNSEVSERTKKSIIDAFNPILIGKDDTESANILLTFVQKAFDYKTDQEVYGTERYFFPDELLHYPYADCEDRSVLYAYLVKSLLNVEVVAIDFPEHMATAINLGENVEGSYFNYNNNTFVVADPTFYGAPLGLLMPGVSDLKAKVIPLENNTNEADIAEKLWKKVNEFGGYKADRLNDVVFNGLGDIYICGYFTESAKFDGLTLSGSMDNRDVFIAKFDSNLNPIWVKSATGSGNDMAFSMAIASDNSIYVYGSVEDELNFSGTEIIAIDAPDVFVAKYTETGELKWARKAGIDKLDHRLDFMFVAKFNPLGEKIMAQLYSQIEDFDHYGLDIDGDGNALIKGSFYATTGMNSNDFVNYNIGNSLDIPAVLHETDVKLKNNEYEATIAGLFAALNLLKVNTLEIEGSEIKSTFDLHNHKFKDYASGIYENLGNMRFMKNDRGIVSVKITEGESIVLDRVKINNEARIRIIKYKSGNIEIEVLSGIYVGAGDNWLDLNSIKLYKETGDLKFIYDVNNSVKKLNLKREILKR